MRVHQKQLPAPSVLESPPNWGGSPANYNRETTQFWAITQRKNPKDPT